MTTVTVAGADLQGVTLTMRPLGILSGRIEFEGGTPSHVQPSQIRVFPTALDPSPRGMMSGPPHTAADFSFTTRGAMGEVLVRVSPPPGWFLKSVSAGGEDITDTPIRLDPGTAVDGVRILLTQTVTTVSGSVRDDRGNVVVDSTVVVFPADDARWGAASRFIRSTRPDTQGRYEFRGLPPYGGYRVIALQGLEDGQMFDPEFLSGARDRADRLTLSEGEAKTLDLHLRQ
jgi:Carboxypeptidase regulatory-like domain